MNEINIRSPHSVILQCHIINIPANQTLQIDRKAAEQTYNPLYATTLLLSLPNFLSEYFEVEVHHSFAHRLFSPNAPVITDNRDYPSFTGYCTFAENPEQKNVRFRQWKIIRGTNSGHALATPQGHRQRYAHTLIALGVNAAARVTQHNVTLPSTGTPTIRTRETIAVGSSNYAAIFYLSGIANQNIASLTDLRNNDTWLANNGWTRGGNCWHKETGFIPASAITRAVIGTDQDIVSHSGFRVLMIVLDGAALKNNASWLQRTGLAFEFDAVLEHRTTGAQTTITERFNGNALFTNNSLTVINSLNYATTCRPIYETNASSAVTNMVPNVNGTIEIEIDPDDDYLNDGVLCHSERPCCLVLGDMVLRNENEETTQLTYAANRILANFGNARDDRGNMSLQGDIEITWLPIMGDEQIEPEPPDEEP